MVLCYSVTNYNVVLSPDADKAKKHGMDEYITADPVKFDHHNLFKTLQIVTLEYRLNDPYCSLVSLCKHLLISHTRRNIVEGKVVGSVCNIGC